MYVSTCIYQITHCFSPYCKIIGFCHENKDWGKGGENEDYYHMYHSSSYVPIDEKAKPNEFPPSSYKKNKNKNKVQKIIAVGFASLDLHSVF